MHPMQPHYANSKLNGQNVYYNNGPGKNQKDALESILTVSNKWPKSNFSNPKIVPANVMHQDITLDQAQELLFADPQVFMGQNTNEISFAPIVKG